MCIRDGHTCNNSWYTLFDGGTWAPWIPSKQNTHAPAANKEEDSGIGAIPHLSRDLIACYDGNGSNFGTHPQKMCIRDRIRMPVYMMMHTGSVRPLQT